MLKIIKSEWHQVEKRDSAFIDLDFIMKVYETDEEDAKDIMQKIKEGEISVGDMIQDAYDTGIDIDWDHEYDDWWTDRKGGYEITYALEK